MFDAKIKPLAVGMPGRREVGAAEFGHLPEVRAVAVHHEELERRRTPEPFLQQAAILVELCAGAEQAAAERDLLAVPREERSAVGPGPVRQPAHVRAVGLHRIDLHVAVADAGEHDQAVRRDRGLGVVAGRARQLRRRRAVGVGAVDVVAVVDRPHVTTRVARPRRTSFDASCVDANRMLFPPG